MTDDGPGRSGSAPLAPQTRIVRISDLPRRPLAQGLGVTRVLGTAGVRAGRPTWSAELIELTGGSGSLQFLDHETHIIAGLSGPQVTIGSGEKIARLRRDRPLRHTGRSVNLSRPLMRRAGTSRVALLSYEAGAVDAQVTFDDLDGEVTLSPSIRVVIVLRGTLAVDGETIGAQSALLRDASEPQPVVATRAQILSVAVATDS